MATTQSSEYDIYEGLWINHSYGRIHGATITLDRQKGAVLIAFLALYVGVAGQGCWRILRFILHGVFSSTANPDGIYNQRQAILRNSDTALAAALSLAQTSFAWRRKDIKHAQRRLLPIATLSFLLALSFAAAGLMSSRVTSNDTNEVLLSGLNCGTSQAPNPNGHREDGFDPVVTTYHAKKFTEHLTYALLCYRNDRAAESERCQTFAKPTLPYTKITNASCPFDQELCSTQSDNMVLDTGYLDSDDDLGINTNPRFSLRQIRHCAPIKTAGYSYLYVSGNSSAAPRYIRYDYYNKLDTERPNDDPQNKLFTWQVLEPANRSAVDYLRYTTQQSQSAYKLGVFSESEFTRGSPTLMLSNGNLDAKVSLVFLDASDITYNTPVSDPWFAATRSLPLGGGEEMYVADQPVGVLGCVTRTHICKAGATERSQCANVFEHDGLTPALKAIWPDERESAAVEGAAWYVNRGRIFDTDALYKTSGLPTLMTQWSIDGTIQTQNVSANQWQIEMEYGFQASLASLQAAAVELATGNLQWEYLSEGPQQSVCNPPSPESCRTVCKNQKIKSPKHYSFSVLGVSIIICLGGLFINVGYWTEWFAMWAQRCCLQLQRRSVRSKDENSQKARHSRMHTYASAEWNATSTLQLQRLAHEALGMITWSKADEAVPVTEKGDYLGVLDLRDSRHPMLIHPSISSNIDEDNPSHDRGTHKTPASHTTSGTDARRSDETPDRRSLLTRNVQLGGRFDEMDSSEERMHTSQQGYAMQQL